MFKPFDLTGKTVLITGGNGGIGLGMARGLLQAGANVMIWGSRAEKTEAAVKSLSTEGARVEGLICDVGDQASVEQCFAQSVERMGPIHGCFANAGVSSKPTRLQDMTAAEFRRVQRVNVDGVFHTFQVAARHIAEHGQGGSLVATASTAAVEGAARNSHYGASKGAVTSYVRALAVELARQQIRVNSILPGWIETEMTARAFGDERFAGAVLPRVPARRWGTIEDFAGIAIYLMSDASSYTTGEQFLIDGGYTKF